MSNWREPLVRVVDPELEAELGSGREHAVRLVGTLCDEVIDEDSNIGCAAVEHDRLLFSNRTPRVDTGHQALAGGLFVACCAIDLSSQIKACYPLCF